MFRKEIKLVNYKQVLLFLILQQIEGLLDAAQFGAHIENGKVFKDPKKNEKKIKYK